MLATHGMRRRGMAVTPIVLKSLKFIASVKALRLLCRLKRCERRREKNNRNVYTYWILRQLGWCRMQRTEGGVEERLRRTRSNRRRNRRKRRRRWNAMVKKTSKRRRRRLIRG